MLMRWALGLAVLFGLLALLARVLQFGFSVGLLVVAALALLAALVSYFMSSRGDGGGGPPATTGRP